MSITVIRKCPLFWVTTFLKPNVVNGLGHPELTRNRTGPERRALKNYAPELDTEHHAVDAAPR